MAPAAPGSTWKPHNKLTTPPTNLKEAIDWVLRVTGKDGKSNKAAASPPASTNNGPHCLCFLAKAVKDLLYDARCPGSPGPHPDRNWDNILLPQEKDIVKPVLQDLGLLGGSTKDTCAGGTEVIKTLIDQLAQGLQKWVGWQETGDDCCLKGESKSGGESKGIGKECKGGGTGGGVGSNSCCTKNGASGSTRGGTPCASHECSHCGVNPTCHWCNAKGADKKCYISAYCKSKSSSSSGSGNTDEEFYWPTLSGKPVEVHLLARIFLGSVCLIWSGLSQLGFLTGGSKRWSDSKLHDISGDSAGLGSFMAAMGYDLERLNQDSSGDNKTGQFVQKLLSGEEPSGGNGIQWQEFASVKDKLGDSVAEYYSSIYSAAQNSAKSSTKSTESICKEYPLLVLHILASGYFRAGSAGAKGIIPAPKAPKKDGTDSASKKPRHPRTIREILYWLSALPYSEKYKALVERMAEKYPKDEKNPQETVDKIEIHGEQNGSTTLKKNCILYYLLAACGYCPLVLIGIQGTIEKEVTQSQPPSSPGSGGAGAGSTNKCPNHKDNPHERCNPKDIKEQENNQSQQQQQQNNGKPLEKGQVCYGGYHLEVSKFGPLHGMYANGLFGFDMDGSAAQCLDQLRVYVYHCFYQLYFLRKQCKEGVVADKTGNTVLGWQSCRYGSGVYMGSGYSPQNLWKCKAEGTGGDDHTKKCGIPSSAGGDADRNSNISPLMCFLCDGIGSMACEETRATSVKNYPQIETHWTTNDDEPKGHFGTKDLKFPMICPVPMGWQDKEHFKDLNNGSHKTAQLQNTRGNDKYPAHCTGNTLSHLLEYYCDPEKQHGTLVLVLRLLACITPTVPRTLGDLFGFYYYIVYIGGKSGGAAKQGKSVHDMLKTELGDVRLSMLGSGNDKVVEALKGWSGECKKGNEGHLKCLIGCAKGATGQCSQYLSPLSGQQYGQLSPAMAGTYLSWLVYLIGEFKTGLEGLETAFRNIACRDGCGTGAGASGCGDGSKCGKGSHGTMCSTGVGSNGVCGCTSVVSCTGVLPVLYKYGFGYGSVTELHKGPGQTENKKCHHFLGTLEKVLKGDHLKNGSSTGLHYEINKLIYTTRLPWIFVLTIAWLVAVLYLAFGAIWPLDWTHMRSHCRGWFRKGSLSPWEVLMVGKKKGRGILEFFGGGNKTCDAFLTTLKGVLEGNHISNSSNTGLHHEINKLIYTTRLPWIFVLTLAWLVAVLYLAFGAIWPLDWAHMRSHCRGWFRKGSLSPWEVLMVGKKKGSGILEFFGKEGKGVVESTTSGYRWVKWLMVIIGTVAVFAGPLVAALVDSNDAWKIPLAVLLGIGGGALLVGVMVKAVVGDK